MWFRVRQKKFNDDFKYNSVKTSSGKDPENDKD